MAKKIIAGICVLLILIQFIRPEKNLSDDRKYDIATKYTVPDKVQHLLQVSCNDCHSNKTVYPWYSEIQPISWWLNNHVEEGKEHLNFSTLAALPIAVQNHKFEETVEMLDEKEMPIPSYTYLGMHKEANLTDEERALIINWAKAQMDTLKANYPADSLILKRKARPVD